MFETMDIPEKPTLYPVIMPDEELKKKPNEIDLWKLIKPRYMLFFTWETSLICLWLELLYWHQKLEVAYAN